MEDLIKSPKTPVKSTVSRLSLIPLGGLENVTRNMYVYEYQDEILLVDCGLGFPDETMLGVDLLLPDISYLLKTNKKIVGLLLTHGHEDHIGGIPYILPQLFEQQGKKISFPIFGTPLTAALANEKLKEYRLPYVVKKVTFDKPDVKLGHFHATFLRITHSVPDTAHIFIRTPAANIYHGSDFKFDLTPSDGKKTDFQMIGKVSNEGITALLSDCVGSERPGHTPSDMSLGTTIERALANTKGKFIVTTFSSHVARINQVIKAAEKMNRKVCFIGRSLLKVKNVAQKLGYLEMHKNTEIAQDDLRHYKDNQLVLLIAGSQGQENAALTRIADGDHKDVSLHPADTVVFSSDPIPGNELTVTELIDSIAKTGAKVLYTGISDQLFHVSGHGSRLDLQLMIALTKPKYVIPISGKYKHMVAYRELANQVGYKDNEVFLLENGLELIFSSDGSVRKGRQIESRTIFVDQVSGEEVESFVMRDREKLAKEGVVIVMVEINSQDGQLVSKPDVIGRGLSPADNEVIAGVITKELTAVISNKKGRVTNWVHLRKLVEDISSKKIFRELRRRPLILPIIIEV